MNSSLVTADGTTHLKVLMVGLVAPILVICVGISARSSALDDTSAHPRRERSVTEPDKPLPAPRSYGAPAIV